MPKPRYNKPTAFRWGDARFVSTKRKSALRARRGHPEVAGVAVAVVAATPDGGNPMNTSSSRWSIARRRLVVCTLILVGAGVAVAETLPTTDPGTATLIDAAIAGKHRSDKNKARDVYRHPKETLTFFGLRKGMTVVEIAPGGGWYTDILAPVLKDHGHYVAALAPPKSTDAED